MPPNAKRSNRMPKENIDLGLAICGATTPPGVRRTLDEIAAFCGCRRSTIWMIEKRALQKLKKAIFLRRDPVLMELMAVTRTPSCRHVVMQSISIYRTHSSRTAGNTL